MALQGTLRDFGIADILQLIGQQQKTGTLHLKTKGQQIDVAFKDGSIVRAEPVARRKKELIGNLLVRAELIGQAQLQKALEEQRRTLKRLGDVLVGQGAISSEQFLQMIQLQMAETLYGLFSWKAGTYEFEQGEVESAADKIATLRAESVLMEGFRRVDEWPQIRKTIHRMDMAFAAVKPLPKVPLGDNTAEDGLELEGEFKSLGQAERRVYGHLAPGRDAQRISELSCLGEFETCKALCNLLNLQYIRAVEPLHASTRFDVRAALDEAARFLAHGVISLAAVAAMVGVATRLNPGVFGFWRPPSSSYLEPGAQKFIAQAQIRRIAAALELYRLERQELPNTLDSLVDSGLLAANDLRHPWQNAYYYRRVSAREFILLPPLR